MQCPIQSDDDAGILLDYCASKLAPQVSAEVERHIGACEPCGKFAAAQRVVWATLDEWQAMGPSSDFNRRLYAGIEHYHRSNWWQRLRNGGLLPFGWRPAIPVAAACLTLIAAVLISPPRSAPVAPQVPSMEIIEPEQVERNLEDLEMLKQLSLNSGTQAR